MSNGADLSKQYQQVDIQTRADSVPPHQMISMAYESVVRKCSHAMAMMPDSAKVLEVQALLKSCMEIIKLLQLALDHENEPEISHNFLCTYQVCIGSLHNAVVTNDQNAVSDVIEIFSKMKSDWDAIPDEVLTQFREQGKQSLIDNPPELRGQ